MKQTLINLDAESRFLESIVSTLPEESWALPTPAQGWTIAHQIAHLTWTDGVTLATLRGEFEPYRETVDVTQLVDEAAELGAAQQPAQLLRTWMNQRRTLAEAFEKADPETRYEWFGPSMGLRAMMTARVMETWAHAQDVADALHVEHPDSAALKDVAFLGVITRDFAYSINGLNPPTQEFRIELTPPPACGDEGPWVWGDESATQGVRGSARDFCLAVTQRRELEQLSLHVYGDEAQQWMSIAQAFAGPSKEQVRAKQAESAK